MKLAATKWCRGALINLRKFYINTERNSKVTHDEVNELEVARLEHMCQLD